MEDTLMNACVAYGEYFATGEGGTFWIAIGNDDEQVRHMIAKNVDPYFAPCIDYTQYKDLPPQWRRWIPEAIQHFLDGPVVHIEYFLKFHYNAS